LFPSSAQAPSPLAEAPSLGSSLPIFADGNPLPHLVWCVALLLVEVRGGLVSLYWGDSAYGLALPFVFDEVFISSSAHYKQFTMMEVSHLFNLP
jgi:hypothetical protein